MSKLDSTSPNWPCTKCKDKKSCYHEECDVCPKWKSEIQKWFEENTQGE